jgi:hypothetical protein
MYDVFECRRYVGAVFLGVAGHVKDAADAESASTAALSTTAAAAAFKAGVARTETGAITYRIRRMTIDQVPLIIYFLQQYSRKLQHV